MFEGYKTYIGAGIALLAGLAQILGFDVAPDAQSTLMGLIEELAVIVGSVIAFYGRAVAKTDGIIAKK
jgi:hypothetical protein